MITLIFCHGRGILSALIRWQTWSYWAHVAVRIDGMVYEAWPGKGVHKMTVDQFYKHGLKGTRAQAVLFESLAQEERISTMVRGFLEDQLGKKYSYLGVIRFVARCGQRYGTNLNRYFCSELIAAAFEWAGRPLLHDDPSKISPGALITSPLLS